MPGARNEPGKNGCGVAGSASGAGDEGSSKCRGAQGIRPGQGAASAGFPGNLSWTTRIAHTVPCPEACSSSVPCSSSGLVPSIFIPARQPPILPYNQPLRFCDRLLKQGGSNHSPASSPGTAAEARPRRASHRCSLQATQPSQACSPSKRQPLSPFWLMTKKINSVCGSCVIKNEGIPMAADPDPVGRRCRKHRQERVAKGEDEILLLMCVSKGISRNGQMVLSPGSDKPSMLHRARRRDLGRRRWVSPRAITARKRLRYSSRSSCLKRGEL